MFRRLVVWLTRRRNRTDAALVVYPDPRDPNHDPREGWSCPAVVGKKKCGRPKTPEEETCKLRACRAWASRKRREQEANQETEQADVFDFTGRRGAA